MPRQLDVCLVASVKPPENPENPENPELSPSEKALRRDWLNGFGGSTACESHGLSLSLWRVALTQKISKDLPSHTLL